MALQKFLHSNSKCSAFFLAQTGESPKLSSGLPWNLCRHSWSPEDETSWIKISTTTGDILTTILRCKGPPLDGSSLVIISLSKLIIPSTFSFWPNSCKLKTYPAATMVNVDADLSPTGLLAQAIVISVYSLWSCFDMNKYSECVSIIFVRHGLGRCCSVAVMQNTSSQTTRLSF